MVLAQQRLGHWLCREGEHGWLGEGRPLVLEKVRYSVRRRRLVGEWRVEGVARLWEVSRLWEVALELARGGVMTAWHRRRGGVNRHLVRVGAQGVGV